MGNFYFWPKLWTPPLHPPPTQPSKKCTSIPSVEVAFPYKPTPLLLELCCLFFLHMGQNENLHPRKSSPSTTWHWSEAPKIWPKVLVWSHSRSAQCCGWWWRAGLCCRVSRPDDRAEGIIGVCRVYLYRWDIDKILLQASPILDFGKIIIYTNNLKIIRAPMDQKELMRRIIQTEGINDWAFKYRERKERFGGGHKKDVEKKIACNQYVQVRENGKCFFSPKAFGSYSPGQTTEYSHPSPIYVCIWHLTKFGLKASLCSSFHSGDNRSTLHCSLRSGNSCSISRCSRLPLDSSPGDHWCLRSLA